MAISRLGMKIREDNIKHDLSNIKRELKDIVEYIQNIEDGKGNLTEGRGLIHKTKSVAKQISHVNRKAVDMQENLIQLAFELGKRYGEDAVNQAMANVIK